MAENFKLTYATMFNPPEELHTRYEEALAKVKAGPGAGIWHAHRRQEPYCLPTNLKTARR